MACVELQLVKHGPFKNYAFCCIATMVQQRNQQNDVNVCNEHLGCMHLSLLCLVRRARAMPGDLWTRVSFCCLRHTCHLTF